MTHDSIDTLGARLAKVLEDATELTHDQGSRLEFARTQALLRAQHTRQSSVGRRQPPRNRWLTWYQSGGAVLALSLVSATMLVLDGTSDAATNPLLNSEYHVSADDVSDWVAGYATTSNINGDTTR